jgi:hypothetical protein
MEDPSRAETWRVVVKPSELDATMVEALKIAEAKIAELEPKVATLLDNLTFLTGESARATGEQFNALSDEPGKVRTFRDRAAEAQAVFAQYSPPERVLVATDALGDAVVSAINALHAADPEPERTHSITITSAGGAWNPVTLPDSWKARQAALAVLGITVTVHQQSSDTPRWVAEMRLPGGSSISGSWPECMPDRTNMFASSRCREQIDPVVLQFTAKDVVALAAS